GLARRCAESSPRMIVQLYRKPLNPRSCEIGSADPFRSAALFRFLLLPAPTLPPLSPSSLSTQSALQIRAAFSIPTFVASVARRPYRGGVGEPAACGLGFAVNSGESGN